MDKTKAERIGVFLRGWGYKPDDLNAYIRQVAPKLEYGAKKAMHDSLNAFFAEVIEQEKAPKKKTPIPPPGTNHESGLGRDLWIMLGTGEDALSLEDMAEYYAEHVSALRARKEAEAPTSANFSKMIYAMGEEDRRQQNCADLIERNRKMAEPAAVSMNDFLQTLNTETDSNPRTLIPPNSINIRADGRANDDLNSFFRNLL